MDLRAGPSETLLAAALIAEAFNTELLASLQIRQAPHVIDRCLSIVNLQCTAHRQVDLIDRV
jgi:hypothetical protein